MLQNILLKMFELISARLDLMLAEAGRIEFSFGQKWADANEKIEIHLLLLQKCNQLKGLRGFLRNGKN